MTRETCSYSHDHVNGEGLDDCEIAYLDEKARLDAIRVSGDPTTQLTAALSVPTCAHDVALSDDCQACIDAVNSINLSSPASYFAFLEAQGITEDAKRP